MVASVGKLCPCRPPPYPTPLVCPRCQPNVAEESEPKVLFSGDEVFGKYLDLHALYVAFYALPQFATLAKVRQTHHTNHMIPSEQTA